MPKWRWPPAARFGEHSSMLDRLAYRLNVFMCIAVGMMWSVLPIMAFDTDDEAVRLANDSEYGLAASAWTRNRARGEALARRIHAGTVMVNDAVSCFGISEVPHGGVKASGIGRTHGQYGLEEMVRIKYLDSDRLPGVKKVWWYGYGETFARRWE